MNAVELGLIVLASWVLIAALCTWAFSRWMGLTPTVVVIPLPPVPEPSVLAEHPFCRCEVTPEASELEPCWLCETVGPECCAEHGEVSA